MAFVLKPKKSYTWPVQFKVPADDGKYENLEITLEFAQLKPEDVNKIISDNDMTDMDVVKKIVLGWKDVKDADEKELPFCEENLKLLLASYFGLTAIITRTFLDSMTGAVAKN